MVTNIRDIQPPDDEQPEETTWEPMDLDSWLAGKIEQPQPSIGMRRKDGLQLIYPGREHAFLGETESGKTWLALGCAAAEIVAGHNVVYIHYEESDPASTIERLNLLGVNNLQIKKHLRFVAPYKRPEPEWVAELLNPVPVLVIHDGVNEAMSLMGVEIFKVDGASEFRRQLVSPFLRAGSASIACDHMPIGADAGRRDAYGSVHKGNTLDGARILLENKEPFGREMRGVSNVFVTKDRPGQLRSRGTPSKVVGKTFIGCLVGDAEDPATPFSLMLYGPKDDGGEDHGSTSSTATGTELGEIVYRVLVAQPGHAVESVRKLCAQMRAAGEEFRTEDIRNALDDLEAAGRVIESPGARGAQAYRAVIVPVSVSGEGADE